LAKTSRGKGVKWGFLNNGGCGTGRVDFGQIQGLGAGEGTRESSGERGRESGVLRAFQQRGVVSQGETVTVIPTISRDPGQRENYCLKNLSQKRSKGGQLAYPNWCQTSSLFGIVK